jgi:hypothetical protein
MVTAVTLLLKSVTYHLVLQLYLAFSLRKSNYKSKILGYSHSFIGTTLVPDHTYLSCLGPVNRLRLAGVLLVVTRHLKSHVHTM